MATPLEGTSWTRPRSLACMDSHNEMLERARARSHELPRHVLERTKFTVACNRGENPGSQCCVLLYADLLLGNLQQVLISKLWSGLAEAACGGLLVLVCDVPSPYSAAVPPL